MNTKKRYEIQFTKPTGNKNRLLVPTCQRGHIWISGHSAKTPFFYPPPGSSCPQWTGWQIFVASGTCTFAKAHGRGGGVGELSTRRQSTKSRPVGLKRWTCAREGSSTSQRDTRVIINVLLDARPERALRIQLATMAEWRGGQRTEEVKSKMKIAVRYIHYNVGLLLHTSNIFIRWWWLLLLLRWKMGTCHSLFICGTHNFGKTIVSRCGHCFEIGERWTIVFYQ